jgi:hypothetical protein
MFRTFLLSNQENSIFIQGARNNDALQPIASVVLQNYDFDSRKIYNMGALSVVDHFGNTINGFGDVIIRTSGDSSNLTERMRVMYNGNVMIGSGYSNARLNVDQDIYAVGYCNLLTSELIASDHKAASASLVTNVNSTAEWASNIAQGVYDFQMNGGTIGGNLDVNGDLVIGRSSGDQPLQMTAPRTFNISYPQSLVKTEDNENIVGIRLHWDPFMVNSGRCHVIADVAQYIATNQEMGYTSKRISIRTSNSKIEWSQRLSLVGSPEMSSSLYLSEQGEANSILLTSGTTWSVEDPFTHSIKVDIVYYPPSITSVYLS